MNRRDYPQNAPRLMSNEERKVEITNEAGEKEIVGGEAKKWKRLSKGYERFSDIGVLYPGFRKEGLKPDNFAIEKLHCESFINYIENILKEKKYVDNPEEKVKVLDLGGGLATYAEQLRNYFGDRVRVYTTGLRKQAVRIGRGAIKEGKEPEKWKHKDPEGKDSISTTLHAGDLKWRSIRELHDFPEFDLVVDTFGEFGYSALRKSEGPNADPKKYDEKSIEEYLLVVLSKLKSGRKASIAGIAWYSAPATLEVVKKVLAKHSGEFKYELLLNFNETKDRDYILKIYKLEKV